MQPAARTCAPSASRSERKAGQLWSKKELACVSVTLPLSSIAGSSTTTFMAMLNEYSVVKLGVAQPPFSAPAGASRFPHPGHHHYESSAHAQAHVHARIQASTQLTACSFLHVKRVGTSPLLGCSSRASVSPKCLHTSPSTLPTRSLPRHLIRCESFWRKLRNKLGRRASKSKNAKQFTRAAKFEANERRTWWSAPRKRNQRHAKAGLRKPAHRTP